MLEVYARFAEDYMAVPVIKGTKTEKEKFAGALTTYCVEAMMQDRRALQAGTSHDLGQNFARAFDVTFQNREGQMAHVWQTSWGVSTRLIGAMVMAHGDDAGLVLPPRLAPTQVAIVPIWRGDDQKALVAEKAEKLGAALREAGVRTEVDLREQYKPGYKFSHWELKGVPLRLELGPRDMEAGQVFAARRDSGEKQPIADGDLTTRVPELLEEIQRGIFERALAFREENTFLVDTYDELKQIIDSTCGFVHAHWCGSDACEEKIQNETKASIRCIPFEPRSRDGEGEGACVACGNPSPVRVIFDKAY
jgi:prolyl-tRNA synthetase